VRARVVAALEATVAETFAEAEKCDPRQGKTWLLLLDGDPKLERTVRAEARQHGVEVTLVLDFIHAFQYLWKAGHALHREGSPELEQWVLEHLRRILEGKVSTVVAGLRRSATRRGLTASQRRPLDQGAKYLLNHKDMMDHPRLLALGAPISTGVVEGTCRSLVNDRMDLTGARWSLAGAEAVLGLRAVRQNGDWDDYWDFHLSQDLHRNHLQRDADGEPPPMALPHEVPRLRRVK
jgi:hypothetical protein